jgi:hypothetical protein
MCTDVDWIRLCTIIGTTSKTMAPNVWPKHAAPLAALHNNSFIAGRGKRG